MINKLSQYPLFSQGSTGTSLPGVTAMCRDEALVYENRRWASPLCPKADLTGPSQKQ